MQEDRPTPMRLVIVTDAWTPQVNGVVRTLSKLKEVMIGRGFDVVMISPSDFRSIPCPTYPEVRLALTLPGAVSGMLRDLQPAYVHIATEGPLGLSARRACLKHRWSFTTSFHTRFPEYLSERFAIPGGLTYRFLRRFHNAASACLVPTQSIRDELESRGFANLRVWTRGVDRAVFHPRAGADLGLKRPVFAYVGRLAPEKNVPAFLSLDLPGSKLVVGDGPSLPAFKRAFPQAVFVGRKEGDDLGRHYAAADVFVFPSRTDTFGLVLLEAIASGLPVAAFPVPGPKDIIGATGAGVLSDDLRQAAMAALAMGRIDPDRVLGAFTWEACADIFQEVLTPVEALAAA